LRIYRQSFLQDARGVLIASTLIIGSAKKSKAIFVRRIPMHHILELGNGIFEIPSWVAELKPGIKIAAPNGISFVTKYLP